MERCQKLFLCVFSVVSTLAAGEHTDDPLGSTSCAIVRQGEVHRVDTMPAGGINDGHKPVSATRVDVNEGFVSTGQQFVSFASLMAVASFDQKCQGPQVKKWVKEKGACQKPSARYQKHNKNQQNKKIHQPRK